MELIFTVKNDYLKPKTMSPPVVTDSINHITVVFEFDEAWSGYEKTAVFDNGLDTYGVLLENDRCIIPWEVLDGNVMSRYFGVSVFGVKDKVRITSSEFKVPLEKSGYSDFTDSEAPSLTMCEQIIAKFSNYYTKEEANEALNNNLSNYYTKEESDEEFPKYDSIITVGEKSASVNTLFEDILTIWDGIFAELRNYCTVEKADETFIKSAEVITDGETSATVHTVLTDSLNLGSYAIRDDTLYYTSGKETNYYWNEIVDEVYKIASKADKPTIINYIDTEEVPTGITLENNTVYQFDVISELSIAYPEEISDSFEALIYFSSNETNINFIYPDGSTLGTKMSGQDCIDNAFAPVANKRYELSLKWDGKYMNGLVGAVSL